MAGSNQPWTEMPARLDVAVVGTGRVGSVLGAALKQAGHNIVACTAISDVSRLRAESLLPQVPVKSLDQAVKDCDLVLFTVPDDVLADLVNGLAQTNALSPGTFVVHTAGRFGDEIFEPLTKQGCLPLALHPVMTFTGTSVDLSRLVGCPFGITAPEQLHAVAGALVVEMGGDPIWIPREARASYHAALAFGSNFLMTIVNETVDLLADAGIQNPTDLVKPLLVASLDNALRDGDQALTGPVVRGDAETVRAHLDALKRNSHDLDATAYQVLARMTAKRALESGRLSAEAAEQLLEVLGE